MTAKMPTPQNSSTPNPIMPPSSTTKPTVVATSPHKPQHAAKPSAQTSLVSSSSTSSQCGSASHSSDSATHDIGKATRSPCPVCGFPEGESGSEGRGDTKEERCATRKELLAEMDRVRAKLGKTPFESVAFNYWRA